MIRESIKAAAKHACNAAGMLTGMEALERANISRLRDAARVLNEAKEQVDAAIAAVERKKADASK